LCKKKWSRQVGKGSVHAGLQQAEVMTAFKVYKAWSDIQWQEVLRRRVQT